MLNLSDAGDIVAAEQNLAVCKRISVCETSSPVRVAVAVDFSAI